MFRNRSIRVRRVSALADEDLMALAQDGEAQAYDVIFDRHAGAAFSLAYRMCGRRALAEEVVQDAFLSLWRSGRRYDPSRGSVRAWVLTVVHNRAVDTFRREIVRGEDRSEYDDSIAEQLPARDDTDAEVERREEATRVRRALNGAPIRTASRDRARIFRRLHAQRDRRDRGPASGHRQGTHAARSDEAAAGARRIDRGFLMTGRRPTS